MLDKEKVGGAQMRKKHKLSFEDWERKNFLFEEIKTNSERKKTVLSLS